MSPALSNFIVPILEIIWIDVLLSGDNAVVIALACAGLPKEQRLRGIILGTAVAIGLRMIFTLLFADLLGLPFIKLFGGLLLLWIAVKLARDERSKKAIVEQTSIFAAVRVIAVADAVMSLDNVIAIAAASKGSPLLILFGLGLSIPLIIFGSSLVLGLINRFPMLIWLGAAMLGFIAGQMIAHEFTTGMWPSPHWAIAQWPYFILVCGVAGAALVILIALMLPRREKTAV
ncbi:MAG: TerC family protein [Methylovirgula sp.]|uniref:TerC family protein n=1 Tax=Methylovirgula sp. TaxID=1978224 RepID=UPI00307608C9